MRWYPFRRIYSRLDYLEADVRLINSSLEGLRECQRDLWRSFEALNKYLGVKTDNEHRTVSILDEK